MQYLRYTGILLLIMLLAGCSKNSNTDDEQLFFKDAQKAKKFANENNAFGLSLFKKLNRQQTESNNFVISPLSTAMILGMTYNGTEGDSKHHLAKVMGWNEMTTSDINQYNKRLIDYLHHHAGNIDLNIANSIWFDKNLPVKSAFLRKNKEHYHAFASSLNPESRAAADIINRWATQSTEGNIDRVIEQVAPNEMLYLLNATFFKGNWKNKFNESNTTTSEFYMEDGSRKPIRMMWQKADLNYFDGHDFQLVELPYENEKFCMYILLPDSGLKLDEMIHSLDYRAWHSYKKKLNKRRNINFGMPRFHCEHSVNMKDMLAGMGLGELFEQSSANLKGITRNNVSISEMMHKAAIDVDEQGTQASAATSMAISFTTLVDDDPFNLIVNRPFIFAIEEKKSNTLLFIGKVSKP